MPRSEAALGERDAQRLGLRISRSAAAERRFEMVEQRELAVRRQRGMVGDVVGGARETVEGEDGRAIASAEQPRGDREILVPVRLAGTGFGDGRHTRPLPGSAPGTRPFQ